MIDALLYVLFGISLLCLLVSIVKPFFGVVAYLIIFMARFPEFMPTLAEIRFEFFAGWYVLIRVFLSRGGVQRLLPGFDRANAGLLAFLLSCVLSVPLAVDPAASWTRFVEYLKMFALAYMALGLVDDRKKLQSFTTWYILMTSWLALGPLRDFVAGNFIVAQDVRRVVGRQKFFSNPNALANNLCQGIPFLYFGLLAASSKARRLVFAALLGMCGLVVVLTGSRGGFLYLTTLLFMFAFRSRNRPMAFLRLALLVMAMLPFMAKDYAARYGTILAFGQSDISAHSRLDGLFHGIGMLRKRPILGVGIGCYPIARGRWFHWRLWAHNHYGELMGELGIVGTIAWFYFLVAVFKNIASIRRALEVDPDRDRWLLGFAHALEASFIGRLVTGMTVHSLGAFFWYMAGALSVTARKEAEAIEEEESETQIEEEPGEAIEKETFAEPRAGPIGGRL